MHVNISSKSVPFSISLNSSPFCWRIHMAIRHVSRIHLNGYASNAQQSQRRLSTIETCCQDMLEGVALVSHRPCAASISSADGGCFSSGYAPRPAIVGITALTPSNGERKRHRWLPTCTTSTKSAPRRFLTVFGVTHDAES